MTTVFSWFVATIITIPLAAYIICFVITKQVTRNHRLAVQISMDTSTILFIFSVHFLIQSIWERSLLWVLLLIIVSLATVVVVVHYKVKQEIIFKRVLKGIWRVNFAFFFFAYFVLTLLGLVLRMVTAFSV